MKVKISITQLDIDNARSSATSCPTALAALRELKAKEVWVGNQTINAIGVPRFKRLPFLGKHDQLFGTLPKVVTSFITKYDAYGISAVEPITFDVYLRPL